MEKKILNINNSFEKFSNIQFENYIQGRKAAILVNPINNLIPIVRTTTIYNYPAQTFPSNYSELINEIKKQFQKQIQFNNAMVELYTPEYRKMGFHSDQSLDLEDNSYICVFSSYKNEPTTHSDLRTLKVKNKISEKHFDIPMENNSAILFDTNTNKTHLHKIILESTNSENEWLGVTLRLSKTFIEFRNNIPYIGNKILRIASDIEKKEFYSYKQKENRSIDFIYPYSDIDYTISKSDTYHAIGLV